MFLMKPFLNQNHQTRKLILLRKGRKKTKRTEKEWKPTWKKRRVDDS